MNRISSWQAPSRRLAAVQLAEQALADLLSSRSLRTHRLSRLCAIGPYVVDYVYPEHALIVELRSHEGGDRETRQDGRLRFLSGMGYTVLSLSREDVLHRPMAALARIQAALR